MSGQVFKRWLSQHLTITQVIKGHPVTFGVDIPKTPSSYGHYTSRVNRPYNEDRAQVGVLDMDLSLRNVIPDGSIEDNKYTQNRINDLADPIYSNEYAHSKVFSYGIFDGHGGDECSDYLTTHLMESVERFKTTEGTINYLMDFYKTKIGGYWKRWARRENQQLLNAMGVQKRIHVQDGKELLSKSAKLNDRKKKVWQFEEFAEQVTPFDFFKLRIFLAFLYTDTQFMFYENQFNKIEQRKRQQMEQDKKSIEQGETPSHLINSGSTCTTAFIYTLMKNDQDADGYYYSDGVLSRLLLAQVGDTRAIICDSNGMAHALTRDHHPSNPTESRRLTKFSANLIMTDSFGEERYLNLANTRAFGDISAKDVGVSAEPEFFDYLIGDPRKMDKYKDNHMEYIKQMGIKDYGGRECFIVLVTDGVTNSASDQEVVDLITTTGGTPEDGAKAVVDYVENVGGEDNATCTVIRLCGWGAWPHRDRTKSLREERLSGLLHGT